MPLAKVKELLGDAVLESHAFREDVTIVIPAPALGEVLLILKNTPGLEFDFLVDLAGVDRQVPASNRFEVVYHLYSMKRNARLRVKVRLPETAPRIASITSIWKGADWYEREAGEMFGIDFIGHPNLKRLLTFEGFVGHPLRKDYPIDQRQSIPEVLKEL